MSKGEKKLSIEELMNYAGGWTDEDLDAEDYKKYDELMKQYAEMDKNDPNNPKLDELADKIDDLFDYFDDKYD